jgi:hypothetical protein
VLFDSKDNCKVAFRAVFEKFVHWKRRQIRQLFTDHRSSSFQYIPTHFNSRQLNAAHYSLEQVNESAVRITELVWQLL